ncbi:MAG: hypothetical protein ABSD71_02035 [Bacteroidales bacterium]|jgi:hypothetical protein
MKRIIFFITILILTFKYDLSAQKINQGVYLTAADFNNGKISYMPESDSKYSLSPNDISYDSPVKIVIGKKVVRLKKDSIFGIRDKNNICYRFFNKVSYKILNPAERILLYSTTSVVGAPRNIHRVTNYFFSENADSPIYPLSKQNLKLILSKDVCFHVLLDVYFSGDRDLTTYDSFNKITMINRVFKESNQAVCKMNVN